MNQKARGFTIVELLIVIVVIAILAALSYVGYTSLTARVENTKTTQAIAQYVKIVSLYALDNGIYPSSSVPPVAPPAEVWICLPYGPASCGDTVFSAPSCLGVGNTGHNAALKTNLQSVATSLPEVSTKEIRCNSGRFVRGALLRIYNSGTSLGIYFFQSGGQPCPTIGGTSIIGSWNSGDAVLCAVGLPDL